MTPRVRKVALTSHFASSVGWLGAVVAYLALVVAALTSQDPETIRAAFVAMKLTYFALAPLALASLLTGTVQALGTPWGLFRHYWVLFKLGLTLFATVFLLLNLQTVSFLADAATEPGPASHVGSAGGQLLHAAVALLVLLLTTILGMFKPRGVTPYGRRKRREQRPTLAK
jgi:hypothetical protein